MKSVLRHIIPDIVIKAFFLAMLASQALLAQGETTTQVVMLQVKELNKIDLVGGPLTLRINSITENAPQPDPAIDASTRLLWTSNGDNRKIAVASNITSPRFLLRIQAEHVSSGTGTAEPEVTLSDSDPHDLILGVRHSSGSCTLKFTAMAGAEQGVGLESHLITYTITGC